MLRKERNSVLDLALSMWENSVLNVALSMWEVSMGILRDPVPFRMGKREVTCCNHWVKLCVMNSCISTYINTKQIKINETIVIHHNGEPSISILWLS